MAKKVIYLLILLFLFSILSIDYGYLQVKEKKDTTFSFINGNKYLLDIPDNQKEAYVLGLCDMCSFFTKYWIPDYYPDLVVKIEHMTGLQIKAIFDKYLEEHPEEWHASAAAIFFRAMADVVY